MLSTLRSKVLTFFTILVLAALLILSLTNILVVRSSITDSTKKTCQISLCPVPVH